MYWAIGGFTTGHAKRLAYYRAEFTIAVTGLWLRQDGLLAALP